MAVDDAYQKAKAIVDANRPRLDEIITEQDARLQLINRILVEVCEWKHSDIKTEPHTEAGYTDYLLKSQTQNRLVVEAKRLGRVLLDTADPKVRTYKVGGKALESAWEGIAQAARYCLDHGVNLAVLTTGSTWIVFQPFPQDGIPFKDGTAFVFPNLEAVLDEFALFYDLLAKPAVA